MTRLSGCVSQRKSSPFLPSIKPWKEGLSHPFASSFFSYSNTMKGNIHIVVMLPLAIVKSHYRPLHFPCGLLHRRRFPDLQRPHNHDFLEYPQNDLFIWITILPLIDLSLSQAFLSILDDFHNSLDLIWISHSNFHPASNLSYS